MPVEKNTDFEKLTWSYHSHSEPLNLIGYGAGNAWTPPLKTPDLLLGMIDRHIMTLASGGPIFWFFMHTMWEVSFNLLNMDALDGHWYNNPDAIGN